MITTPFSYDFLANSWLDRCPQTGISLSGPAWHVKVSERRGSILPSGCFVVSPLPSWAGAPSAGDSGVDGAASDDAVEEEEGEDGVDEEDEEEDEYHRVEAMSELRGPARTGGAITRTGGRGAGRAAIACRAAANERERRVRADVEAVEAMVVECVVR